MTPLKTIRTMHVSALFSKICQLFWTFWHGMISTIYLKCCHCQNCWPSVFTPFYNCRQNIINLFLRLVQINFIFSYKVQYTPSVSTIILSGPTYSSQKVRQIWESTLSKFDYLVGHFGLGRTFWLDVRVDIKRFFFTFLEVNMSNILWSMRICKRTFFPVCRMCGYVNTLGYFYLAPYSRQER